jgi:hypothetical protein
VSESVLVTVLSLVVVAVLPVVSVWVDVPVLEEALLAGKLAGG